MITFILRRPGTVRWPSWQSSTQMPSGFRTGSTFTSPDPFCFQGTQADAGKFSWGSGRPPAPGWAKQGRSCRRCSLQSTPSSRTRASPTLRRWRRTSTCSRASESSTLSQPRWQSSESHGSNNLGAGGRICWVSLSAPISVRTLEVQTGHPKNWFAYTLKIEAWCSRMRFWEILFNERLVPGSLTDQHRRGRQDLFWKI